MLMDMFILKKESPVVFKKIVKNRFFFFFFNKKAKILAQKLLFKYPELLPVSTCYHFVLRC